MPPETLYNTGSLPINAGRNVYIENPFAHISTDVLNLARLSEKSGSRFMTGYPELFHPAVCKMKDILDKGVIGELIYIQSCRLRPDGLNTDESKLWSMVESDILLMNHITGRMPVSIKASGGSYLDKKAFDTINAVFGYEGAFNA